jgi:hypothetical protein
LYRKINGRFFMLCWDFEDEEFYEEDLDEDYEYDDENS